MPGVGGPVAQVQSHLAVGQREGCVTAGNAIPLHSFRDF